VNTAKVGALVFVATASADFAWTCYVASIAAGSAHHAALWSSAIVGFGGVVTLALVRSRWHLIPAMLGAYVGTAAAMLV
jgi:hypothetical protein